MFGNRGGRFHCLGEDRVQGRPFASRQWICCRLAFKGRQRKVWGKGYTELFFSDEVTALAAGHRPCFECRREDAIAFAAAWGRAKGASPPRAPEMDRVLHEERLAEGRGYAKRLHPVKSRDLPNGALVMLDGQAYGVQSGHLLRWTFAGFQSTTRSLGHGESMALTPPSILAVLVAGYRPQWRMAGAVLAGAVGE